MADILTPLVLLGLGAAALFAGGEKKKEEKVGPQSTLDPEALDLATELRSLPGGGQARYFRADVGAAIMTLLAGKSLEPVTVPGGTPGLVFRVVPLSGFTAQAACLAANSQGFAVFASVSTPVITDPSDKLVMFGAASQRAAIAGPSSKLAILLDAGAVATTAPGLPGVPGGVPGSPFDVGMPPEIEKEVNAALSDPDADPDGLDKMAAELEASGFPVAAASLRRRAQSIRLKDKLSGGVPFLIRSTAQGNASDLPFNVAKHYTGDGNRWKEIVPVNGKLGMIIKQTAKWGPLPDPWSPNLTILLPLAWNPRSKPLPKPVSEPSKASQAAAEKVHDTPPVVVTKPADEPAFGPPPAPAKEPEPNESDVQKATKALDEEESKPGALHRTAAGREAAIQERARAEAALREFHEKSKKGKVSGSPKNGASRVRPS